MKRWKAIEGFAGLYEISDTGEIKCLHRYATGGKGSYDRPERILKPSKSGRYVVASLCKGGVASYKHVHRLVAEAFIPNPEGLPYVNHIDGDMHNNAVSNLEWITNSDNQKHSIYTLGNGVAKPVYAFDKRSFALAHTFPSITVAGEWLLQTGKTKDKTCLTGIIKSCKGTIPSYMGFIWQYVLSTSRD